MKKKILTGALLFSTVLTLAGCFFGSNDKEEDTDEPSVSSAVDNANEDAEGAVDDASEAVEEHATRTSLDTNDPDVDPAATQDHADPTSLTPEEQKQAEQDAEHATPATLTPEEQQQAEKDAEHASPTSLTPDE